MDILEESTVRETLLGGANPFYEWYNNSKKRSGNRGLSMSKGDSQKMGKIQKMGERYKRFDNSKVPFTLEDLCDVVQVLDNSTAFVKRS